MTKQHTNGQADLSQYVFGKAMPSSPELEQAVLGACTIDKHAFPIIESVFGDQNPFYEPQNGAIYRAMRTLYANSRPIDLLTVIEQLKKTGELETGGGPAYIADLAHRVASAANIEYHARIVMQKHIRRRLIDFSNDLTRTAYDPAQDDLDLIEVAERGVFGITSGIVQADTKDAAQMADIARRRFDELCNTSGELVGLPWGYNNLNKFTAGLQAPDLIIIAARPSMGKTAFALNVAEGVARAGHGVGIFSLEMSNLQLTNRILSSISGVPLAVVNNPARMTESERGKFRFALETFSPMPLQIDDTPAISIMALRSKARRMVKEGAKLIVVDYLQLMTGDNAKTGGNRDQEIGTISRGLKAIAKELNVPVIALSQLSRAVETRGGTKEPMMSDLRESGNIEQDADIVTFLYRPEYYKITEAADGSSLPAGITKLIFAKHRNGPLGEQFFRFFGANTRFVEYDPENPVQDEYMPTPASAHSEAMERAKPGVEDDVPF